MCHHPHYHTFTQSASQEVEVTMAAQPSTPPPFSPKVFRFQINPGEDDDTREARWDKEIGRLHATGYTILGTGPDLDWPVRFEFLDEHDLAGPFVEIFDVTPLPESENH